MGSMKTYKQLLESLPPKTVVFAFGRFNPPTTGHHLLVEFVKKTAKQKKADHIIFASRSHDKKKNPLSVDRKLHYLKLMFPGTNFAGASAEMRTFLEVAATLNRKYSSIIMVGGSDRVQEYQRLLTTYNGTHSKALFNFSSIQVMSAGERDPDSDDVSGMSASKMRAFAAKGDFTHFRQGVPATMRDIDVRRLMNDVRDGMGLEVIKEQINVPYNSTRDSYIRGNLYSVGDTVLVDGNRMIVEKCGTNYLLVKDSAGAIQSKWLHEVTKEPK